MKKIPFSKCLSAVLVTGAISILYTVRWMYVSSYSLQIKGNITIELALSNSSSDHDYSITKVYHNSSLESFHVMFLDQHENIGITSVEKTNEIGKKKLNDSKSLEAGGVKPTEKYYLSSESTLEDTNSSKLKIGILIPSSTRNIQKPVLQTLSLVNISIPSLYNTFEKKYMYKIYIGVDKGDRLENFHDEIKRMFDCVVMVSAVGKNFVKSVNTIAEKAYNDGMDYLVRINDDTKFVTENWTSLAIKRLREYIPQNIGVVGPTCTYGNVHILTHDMVHRTHLEIFNFYYPPYFENWWADDWITRVYEPERSTKLRSWTVKHLEGTLRYKVDFERQNWVKSIIEFDRKRLKKYLESSFAMKLT